MIVLILCAGNQDRFNDDFARPPQPKQLLPVHGVPLLNRTVQQVLYRGQTPVVVTHDDSIAAVAQRAGAGCIMPRYRDKTCSTLWSTRGLWQERTVVLLGDVYYKQRCFNAVLGFDGKLAFFGDVDEIFGVSFTPHRALDHAITRARHTKRGKLWELYRACEGLDLEEHVIRTNGIFHYVDDGTADVDTWEEYKALLRRIE